MSGPPVFPASFASAFLRAAEERISTLKSEIEERQREIQQLQHAHQFFGPSGAPIAIGQAPSATVRHASPLTGNALRVYEWLAHNGPHPLAHIKRELGLPNSTVHGTLTRGEGVHFRRTDLNRWEAIPLGEGKT